MGNQTDNKNKTALLSSSNTNESLQTASEGLETQGFTPAGFLKTKPGLEQTAGNIQRVKTQAARQTVFRSYTKRYGNNSSTQLARHLQQVQRLPENIISRDPYTDEAAAIEEAKTLAAGWMKPLVEKMAAMELDHLKTLQQVTEGGKVPGIDNKRLAAAIDSALSKKIGSALKTETLDWLVANSINHADQVIEIRDIVGLALFEPAFIRLVKNFGTLIQAVRAGYETTMSSKTIATDKDKNSDPKADNENRRKATETAYRGTQPLLDKLKEITKGRAARYKADDPKAEDTILAALELETVFNAEATLGSPDNARADAANAVGMDKSIEWCGAFVAKSYVQSELVDKMVKGFPSTERLEAFFHYDQYLGTEPKWIYDQGEWKLLKDYQAQRGSPRKWTGDDVISAQGKSGDLDIRPGDVILLDNNPNKRADIEVADSTDPTKTVKKTIKYSEIPAGAKIVRVIEGEKADHVQMVQSWNPATRELFLIEGNSDGYIIDKDPAHPAPAGESDAKRKKREDIEAATGQKLTNGKDGSHVAVGMNDLADQPDPKKLAANRSARVYGIGRLSIVDFEMQTYDNSAKKPAKPPKTVK